MLLNQNDIIRLIESLDMSGECWTFKKALNSAGYGTLHIGGRRGKRYYTHRLAYEFFLDKISGDKQIDHLCRNRACSNPHHLEAVSQLTNLQRGYGVGAMNARKTTCPRGHIYTADNLLRYGNKKQCRICRNYLRRARRQKERIELSHS